MGQRSAASPEALLIKAVQQNPLTFDLSVQTRNQKFKKDGNIQQTAAAMMSRRHDAAVQWFLLKLQP